MPLSLPSLHSLPATFLTLSQTITYAACRADVRRSPVVVYIVRITKPSPADVNVRSCASNRWDAHARIRARCAGRARARLLLLHARTVRITAANLMPYYQHSQENLYSLFLFVLPCLLHCDFPPHSVVIWCDGLLCCHATDALGGALLCDLLFSVVRPSMMFKC